MGATTRQQGRAQQTRNELIDAAIERLAKGGQSVNFDGIAGDVGLTKGALYHHFGSVNGLVEEVYKEAVRRHAAQVIEASREGTGGERLMHLVRVSSDLYGSGTPFYRLLLRLHVEAGASRPELAEIALRVQRREREYITSLVEDGQADGSIRDDVEASAMGETVNAALQGFLVKQLEPPQVQKRAADSFAELLEQLIIVGGPGAATGKAAA
jgi:AcrR family transcriptional regulator